MSDKRTAASGGRFPLEAFWIVAGLIVGALVLVVGGLVLLVRAAGLEALRWWAGVATAILPLVAGASWALGRWQAREVLKGVDLGVDRVMRAAQGTADLRTAAVREARRPAAEVGMVASDLARQVVIYSATPALGDGRGGGEVVEIG